MKIIFMGTPAFAVPTLKALIANPNHEVVAVYTKQPKTSGRGLNINKSLTHIIAEEHDIPVMHPSTLKSEEALIEFSNFKADIAVVAAYGLILPASILKVPKYGCINIHPSDLPRWRGAAPIQRTIMAGDLKGALCIMQMDEGLDSGDIIIKEIVDIPEDYTADTLESHMAELGAINTLRALSLIAENNSRPYKQSAVGVTYANKVERKEEHIIWNKDAKEISCQIRAFSPKPGAYFIYNNERVKIIDAIYDEERHNIPPGTVVDNNLKISCKTGFIYPKLLQREGKKMIYTEAFLRGFKVAVGSLI